MLFVSLNELKTAVGFSRSGKEDVDKIIVEEVKKDRTG